MTHPEQRPNPGRSPEPLEARLRALPQPPVPADLEARLLAAIPPAGPVPRRRWAVWAGVAGALAAACLLAVLAWRGRDGKAPAPSPQKTDSARQAPSRPPEEDGIAAWREARRVADGEELPPFTWPLDEPAPVGVATSIPPDLFE
jgi:hypothetical protein